MYQVQSNLHWWDEDKTCWLIYITPSLTRLNMPGLQVTRHFADNHAKDHTKVIGIIQCGDIGDIHKQRIIHLIGTLHPDPVGLNISVTAFKK